MEEPLKPSRPAESQFPNPVFVVGVLRSGTSLLYSLLNQHPQVALMFECDFWDFPETFSRLRFRGGWLERQEFYNQALSRHRLIYGGSLRGLEGARSPEELYRIFGECKTAALWGEKSPFYSRRLRQLARQYPRGSFILLWRDPVEIYRSMSHAARDVKFFRRRGMLDRLIFYQEQLLQQAAELESHVRVHRVTYDDLIARTEEVCGGICRFLGIEFDGKMLDLTNADYSAVYSGTNHDYLRRGIIERQQFSGEPIAPAVLRKLERFGARWQRLNGLPPGPEPNAAPKREPSFVERLYHKVAGKFWSAGDDVKRVLFEFLPLSWLRTYRQMQGWLLGSEAAVARPSFRQQFAAHWFTILACAAMVAGVAACQSLCDPRMVFIPFYMIPCGALTLIVDRRWGTFAAIASAVIGPLLQSRADPAFAHFGVVLWNSTMRLAVLGFFILLLDRVRLEIASANGQPQK